MTALNVPHISQPVAELKDGKYIVNPDWHRFFDQLQAVAADFEDTGLTGSGIASVANVRSAATGDKVIVTALLESASAPVALTDAATIAFDWDAGINFTVTLGGNRTLGNPTNGQPGTWRTILFTQDGTGNRTLAFDTQYVFPNGEAPTLSTAASANDRLMFFCRSSTVFECYGAGLGLAA